MNISYKWLKQYVDLPDSLTPEELGLALTMSTVEVEGIHRQADAFEHIVVGVIKKVKKHENADSLKVCEVDLGNEMVQIVCGGSNVREGMKVVVGKIGARVKWHGEGELVELKPVKIRGVDSVGMICGADEVGLLDLFPKTEEKEIVDLSKIKAKAGTSLAVALGLDDVVIEVDNKSINHRPDLWGHYGIAREVAARYRKKFPPYVVPDIKEGDDFALKVSIERTDDSMKYVAVVMDGIVIGPSPENIQQRLRSVGIRPVNNVVDITNYVMCDLGQPMHAFDASKVNSVGRQAGSQNSKVEIQVRRAKVGEKLTTLDHKERELTEDMIVIADTEKVIALAGIMGGEDTEITPATTSIIFEAAHFNPVLIRKTSAHLGLRSDSSTRFEKSLDPHNCIRALKRAVELVQEVCPSARVASEVVEKGKVEVFKGPIVLTKADIDAKMGMVVPTKECVRILESLGFGVKVVGKKESETLKIEVPTWRGTKDITIAEDVVEEIARVYGYDNIETRLPVFSITPPERNELKLLERSVRVTLSRELGFTETLNYSFISPQSLQLLELDPSSHLELDNPIARDRPYLRRSLLPNILELVERNSHTHDEVKVYEIGKVFVPEDPGPRESESGDNLLPRQDVLLGISYTKKGDDMPFFVVSDALRRVGARLGIELYIDPAVTGSKYVHAGRYAKIMAHADHVGEIFEVHPKTARAYGMGQRVVYAEINLRALSELVSTTATAYRPLSIYPAVERDIAFVVDSSILHRDIHEIMMVLDPLIVSAVLFDVFEGKNIPKGKKSMGYRLVYQSNDHTLETVEIDAVHEKVEKFLSERFGAEIRD